MISANLRPEISPSILPKITVLAKNYTSKKLHSFRSETILKSPIEAPGGFLGWN